MLFPAGAVRSAFFAFFFAWLGATAVQARSSAVRIVMLIGCVMT
jgi:hypothetical protein